MTRRSVVFLLAALSCASVACQFLRGPRATVERFYAALDHGDLSAAIDCLSPRVVQQLGIEKLRAGLQSSAMKLKQKGGIKKLVIEREDVVGEIAEVKASITTGNGESDSDTFKLAKENGVWRIQSPK
jgi:hypothetical protein